MELKIVGSAFAGEAGFGIRIAEEYRSALYGLEGFSHLIVLWWASLADEDAYRSMRRVPKPYVGAPEELGILATRSPMRPNPLCLSVVSLQSMDEGEGIILADWHDMEDGTPVLDVKPYHPSSDRVEAPRLPPWCSSWPRSLEESASFDWSKVFLFG